MNCFGQKKKCNKICDRFVITCKASEVSQTLTWLKNHDIYLYHQSIKQYIFLVLYKSHVSFRKLAW